ncbi:MAG TPA: hypothetical protein VMI06_00275 [Terriglobia bacterium]|nr:hypothetical protein [Terriglobia bacterium]
MDDNQRRLNQFLIDACRTSTHLAAICRRVDPEARINAIANGREAYEELLTRRDSLNLSPEDSFHVQGMLDEIRARLKFLQGPNARV